MIDVYSKYGDPRTQAVRANTLATAHMAAQRRGAAGADPMSDSAVDWQPGRPVPYAWHGAPWMHTRSPQETQQLRDRFEKFVPRLAASRPGPDQARGFFNGFLPQGAQLAPNAGNGYATASQKHWDMRKRAGGERQGASFMGYPINSGGSDVYQQQQAPYQPEFASPDRQNYPTNRNTANIYWRLFYKLDHIAGSGVDSYSELPWGNCEFTGEGVDGEPKELMERSWEVCNIRALLPYFVREYLVLGEACPHAFYDKTAGIWTYVGMHDPDQLEVIYTPFIKMDPIVRFRPDNRLQKVLSSSSPMVAQVRESIPPELYSALMSGQAIELHPLNFTFLPRKSHPYDVRGTSIYSRMWRVFMLEDAIYNASIAVARRASSPLKVAKLGDRATGWIPDPSHEQRLLELLMHAEQDPTAWLVYNYGIEFDLVGVQERTWKIDQSSEFIERVKLMALGLSKSFTWGEVTYASAQSGLTVFLQRLKALREYFEASWIIPKFFKPLAVMHGWIKPTQAELSHGVRTRRSFYELLEDNRYIVPTIEWSRQLDPSVDGAQLEAVKSLQGLGVHFSKQYLASLVGRDWEEQLRARAREAKIEKEIFAQNPDLQMSLMTQQNDEGGGPAMLPGLPPPTGEPSEGGPPMDGGGAEPMPPSAGVQADTDANGGGGPGRQWNRPELWQDGRYGGWDADVVADLIRLYDGQMPDDETWTRMLKAYPEAQRAAAIGDTDHLDELVEQWLVEEGYPAKSIRTLQDILKSEIAPSKNAGTQVSETLQKELNRLENDDPLLLVGAP